MKKKTIGILILWMLNLVGIVLIVKAVIEIYQESKVGEFIKFIELFVVTFIIATVFAYGITYLLKEEKP